MKKIDEKFIRDFCNRHNIEIVKERPIEGGKGKELLLAHCVFNESHTAPDAKILIFSNGSCGYKCHHDSCKKFKLPDFIKKFEPDFYKDSANSQEKKASSSFSREEILAAVESMEDVEEVEPEWIVYPYIPRGEVIILAARGGTGKGFIVANILAGITNGKYPTIWGKDNPFQGDKELVLYLTTEDDGGKVLKKRFRQAGVNMDHVKIISRKNPIIQEIKLTDKNDILKVLLNELKPSLVIFDPLQSFLPDRVKMSERNQMRTCVNNLSVIGAETNTSFLIFCHMNKRDTTDIQKAISDSGDIWDIARSVLAASETETDGINFLSHEKSNYSALGETALYQIVDPGKAVHTGTTKKRYKDFALAANASKYNAPKRVEAADFIIDTLQSAEGNKMIVSELDDLCIANGISKGTLRRAKEDLRKEKKAVMWCTGYGREKKWFIGFKKPILAQEQEQVNLDYRQLELP